MLRYLFALGVLAVVSQASMYDTILFVTRPGGDEKYNAGALYAANFGGTPAAPVAIYGPNMQTTYMLQSVLANNGTVFYSTNQGQNQDNRLWKLTIDPATGLPTGAPELASGSAMPAPEGMTFLDVSNPAGRTVAVADHVAKCVMSVNVDSASAPKPMLDVADYPADVQQSVSGGVASLWVAAGGYDGSYNDAPGNVTRYTGSSKETIATGVNHDHSVCIDHSRKLAYYMENNNGGAIYCVGFDGGVCPQKQLTTLFYPNKCVVDPESGDVVVAAANAIVRVTSTGGTTVLVSLADSSTGIMGLTLACLKSSSGCTGCTSPTGNC